MKSSFCVKGKKILVTGAASGIGLETALLLTKLGAIVFAIDKNEESLIELNKIENITTLRVDLTIDKDRKELINAINEPFDGLVNSAGIINLIPMKFVTEKQLNEINFNNYQGPVLITNELLKKKKISNGGSIVFLSSIMSVLSTPTNGMYTGSKAAIAGISKTYALELAPLKIRVNSISPGFVKTPMLDFISNFSDINDAEKKHPLGLGEPSDIANLIIFLLSDASKWITGTNVIIDGGYSAS